MKKSLLYIFSILLIVCSGICFGKDVSAKIEERYHVMVNDNTMSCDVITIDNVRYLPLKFMSENMGFSGSINWSKKRIDVDRFESNIENLNDYYNEDNNNGWVRLSDYKLYYRNKLLLDNVVLTDKGFYVPIPKIEEIFWYFVDPYIYDRSTNPWGCDLILSRKEILIPMKDFNNQLWGLINEEMEWVVEPKYKQILAEESTDYKLYYKVKNDSKWKLLDEYGMSLIDDEYDDIKVLNDESICVEKNGKWGLVNYREKVTDIKYDGFDYYNIEDSCIIAFSKKEKSGKSNKYNTKYHIFDGRDIFAEEAYDYVVDVNGQYLVTAELTDEEPTWYETTNDQQNTLVRVFSYSLDYLMQFGDEYELTYEEVIANDIKLYGSVDGFFISNINSEGNQYYDKYGNERLLNNRYYGEINGDSYEIIKNKDSYEIMSINGNIGYFPNYDSMKKLSHGWCETMSNGKYGFMNLGQDWVIEPQYLNFKGYLAKGIFFVQEEENDEVIAVNQNNEKIFSMGTYNLDDCSFVDQFIYTKGDNYLKNVNGQVVRHFPNSIDKVDKLISGYYHLIGANGGVEYFIDSKGKDLNLIAYE